MARARYDDEYGDDDRRPGRFDDFDDDDYGSRPRGPRPPNYLVQSILITLCCCLIGGIVAIVHAAQVNSKWDAGDYVGAREASDKAKFWCWLSFGIGLVTNLIYIVAQVMIVQQAQQGGGFR